MSFFAGRPAQPILLAAGEGRSIVGPTGAPMIIKAGAEDTRGAYAAIEYSHAAATPGPPAHVHHDHEEAFIVLEGELTLLVGPQTLTVGPGGFALVPRGTVHRPSNAGDVPVRFLFLISPPLEGFFLAMEDLLRETGGRPATEQLAELGARWDTAFVGLDGGGSVQMHNEQPATGAD